MKILLVTTSRWASTARMAMALTEVGCEVTALCPHGHPMLQTKSVRKHLTFRHLLPVHSIKQAIRQTRPDFIIPGDELAVFHLHRVHAKGTADVRALVERSLGDAASYPLTHNASQLMAVAQEAGVATPVTAEVSTPKDIPGLASRFGLPLVLKADGTTGGTGVRILTEVHGKENLWRGLRASISPARLLKRMLVDSDWSMVIPFLRGDIRTVNAQAFISGTEANIAVACWQGEVVSSICLEVVSVWYERGPSSVVRVIDNPVIVAAARKMVKRLNLSGFCGFDFMLDENSGAPMLLEMNARPTQLCHLQLGPGRDLITAWTSAATDLSMRARPAITDKDRIAVFPHELYRDASSPMLHMAYHDVPWSEPSLVMSCIRKPSNWAAWHPNLRWIGLGPSFGIDKG